MSWHRRLLAGSAAVVQLALAGVAVRGVDLGVEFTGGRLVEFSTGRVLVLRAAALPSPEPADPGEEGPCTSPKLSSPSAGRFSSAA